MLCPSFFLSLKNIHLIKKKMLSFRQKRVVGDSAVGNTEQCQILLSVKFIYLRFEVQ